MKMAVRWRDPTGAAAGSGSSSSAAMQTEESRQPHVLFKIINNLELIATVTSYFPEVRDVLFARVGCLQKVQKCSP